VPTSHQVVAAGSAKKGAADELEEKKERVLVPAQETLLSRKPDTTNNPVLNPNTLAKKMSLKDLNWDGKRVLVRVDYNVPIKDNIVQDATRIETTLDTINHLLTKGKPKCIVLIAHLGQPAVRFPVQPLPRVFYGASRCVHVSSVISLSIFYLIFSFYQLSFFFYQSDLFEFIFFYLQLIHVSETIFGYLSRVTLIALNTACDLPRSACKVSSPRTKCAFWSNASAPTWRRKSMVARRARCFSSRIFASTWSVTFTYPPPPPPCHH
jgi:hypothetical protein